MLKEEAHHMFVGAGGVGSAVQRIGRVTMRRTRHRRRGSLRRYQHRDSAALPQPHQLAACRWTCSEPRPRPTPPTTSPPASRVAIERAADPTTTGCKAPSVNVPAVEAGGADGRDRCRPFPPSTTPFEIDYIDDCQNGLDRWNRTLAPAGAALRLPHVGFHRAVGVFSGHQFTPEGLPVTAEEWSAGHDRWLPTEDDRAHVASPGGPRDRNRPWVAGWLAARQWHSRQAGRLRIRPALMRDPFNAAVWLVDRHVAAGRGERVAFHCEDRSLTYRALQEATWAAANGLKSVGIETGDRVAHAGGRRGGVPRCSSWGPPVWSHPGSRSRPCFAHPRWPRWPQTRRRRPSWCRSGMRALLPGGGAWRPPPACESPS